MKCPHCQRELPDKSTFCGYCGTKLPQFCPNCGEALEAGTLFCGNCGIRLEGAPGAEPVPTTEQETIIAPTPPQVNAELVVKSGPASGQRFAAQHGLRLGRGIDNDIVLDDLKVSRHHAVITIEGDRCFIHDQNSANGTFVNEERISQRELQLGDSLRLGDTQISFQQIGATVVSAAPLQPQAPPVRPAPAPPSPAVSPPVAPTPRAAPPPLPAAAYPATAPVVPKPRSRRRSCLVVGLCLLAILIVICTVGIYVYPQVMQSLPLELQTLTWEDYSDQGAGFAASYPFDWNVQESEGAIYFAENADDIQGGAFVAVSQVTEALKKLEEEAGAPLADPQEALRAYVRAQGLMDEPTNEFGDFVGLTRGEYTGAIVQISNSETGRRTQLEVYQAGDKWWKLSSGAPLSQWEHYWPVLNAISESVHFLSVEAEGPSSPPQPTPTVGEATSTPTLALQPTSPPTAAPQPTNTPARLPEPTDVPPPTALPPSTDTPIPTIPPPTEQVAPTAPPESKGTPTSIVFQIEVSPSPPAGVVEIPIAPLPPLPAGRHTIFEREGDIYVATEGAEEVKVVSDPSTDYEPVFSPEGERIAFTSDRSGNGDIYILDLVASRLTLFAGSEGRDWQPAWMADGKLLFASDRSGVQQIYAAYPDGSGLVNLTDDDLKHSTPEWTADNRVAFSTFSTEEARFVEYLMNADGSGREPIAGESMVWNQTSFPWGQQAYHYE